MFESKGAIIGLTAILVVAVSLEFLGHLSMGMVSVLQWVGGAYFGAQGAAHIGLGLGNTQGSGGAEHE